MIWVPCSTGMSESPKEGKGLTAASGGEEIGRKRKGEGVEEKGRRGRWGGGRSGKLEKEEEKERKRRMKKKWWRRKGGS